MKRGGPSQLRCAIYTRKSSEEGLDQSFNSLDAQREACEAYVLSQTGEGWRASPKSYDDGGFSGGSMERPGLRALLADIEKGLVDIVVVYKVDRLTRSLTDFAKIVEIFDRQGVSFVSVTQAFNTTTSMGRLTLNVLLSFAQFEREVTGERIRDKIAASKAKGMWMGGCLPLGYDAPKDQQNRALVVNAGEAETVRLIFARYLELGSVHALVRWLDEAEIRSKVRQTTSGRVLGGVRFTRGALFHLLKNRTYIGETVHRDRSYPGMHEGIVPVEVFEAVQQRLASQTHERKIRAEESMPLCGRIFDAAGAAMSPTYTTRKGNRRYRYYSSTGLLTGERTSEGMRRISAPAVEGLVGDALIRLFPERSLELRAITRTEVYPDTLQIVVTIARVCPAGCAPETFIEALTARAPGAIRLRPEDDDALRIIIPCRQLQRGSATKIVRADARAPTVADPALIKGLVQAHRLAAQLADAPVGAPERGMLRASPASQYERNLLPLVFLAPDLQEAILAGEQPPGLTLQALVGTPLSICWAEQRRWFARFQ